MTHVKKSLALLLAIVMMFSSMSVAASAWDPNVDGGKKVDFTVKFFREVDDEWIETERAKPGEKVKMRVYLTTDFIAYSSNVMTMFDTNLLVPTFKAGRPMSGDYEDDNFHYDYASNYNYRWETEEKNFDTGNAWYSKIPADFFNGYDLINAQNVVFNGNSSIVSGSTNSDYMFEFNMKVVDGEAANTVGYVGKASVPQELMASPTLGDKMPTNVPKCESAADYGDGMWVWEADVTTIPGTLTTTSNFILNANGGSFDGKETELASGIIGKHLEGFGTAKPSMLGYVFEGYTNVPVDKDHKITAAVAEELGLSSSSIGNYLTDDQFNSLLILPEDYSDYTYDYEDQNVYAAWTKSEATEVTYSFEIYKLKVGGDANNADDYELASRIPMASKLGAQVTMPEFPMEGFHLNKTLSDVDPIIVKDDSSKLKHYYTRNEYKVTYHYTDAGEQPQEEVLFVQYGATVPACNADPGKPEYAFKGWSLNDDNTIKNVPEIMPAYDLDVYPVLEYTPYHFDFVAESEEGVKGVFPDGDPIKSYVVKYGSVIDDETKKNFVDNFPKPIAKGYIFNGWDKDLPGIITGDMTFRAMYTEELYEVTFVDANNPSLNHKIFRYYNDTVTEADIPEGYTTTGWSVDGGTSLINFPYTVTDDVTLSATETAGYIDAIFMADGKEYDRISVKIGEEIPAPAEEPTKYGYDFIGWDPNVGNGEGPIMDTDGAVIDAIFEPKTVTITFVTDGGTKIPEITQKFGTDVEAPANPKREGHEFLRWDLKIPATMPAEDMTITAIWARNTYKIEYKDTDGKLIASETYKFGEEITKISDPSKTGYTFECWNIEIPAKMPANNLVATAEWTTNEYTITFDENGGSEVADITAGYGEPITAPETKLEDKKFIGWALADDESKTIITFPATMPVDGMNLVAVWESEKIDFVVFNAKGGQFNDGTATYIVKNVPVDSDVDDIKPADPTRLGFIFGGWKSAGVGVFEAIWNPDPNYDITYTINIVYIVPTTGEEVTFDTVTGTANNGQTVEVVEDRESSDAEIVYTFDELAPSKNHVVNAEKTTETTINVTAGGNNEITIYYVPAKLTAEFLANGGQFDDGSDKITLTGAYGDEIKVPAEPTRFGYDFAGWDNEVTGTFVSDATYKANWTKKVSNAIFNVKDEDGNIIETIKVPYEYGAAVEAPAYNKVGAGQTFSGWVVPEGTTMGAADMTFNATLANIEYTVTYVFNGMVPAGAVTPASQKVILGGKVTVATPNDVDGYTFNGWNTADGTEYAPGSELTIEDPANVVLSGSWEEIPVEPTYKELTYVYEGDVPANATALPETTDVEVGSTVKLAPIPAAVDGYTFAGWYKDGVLTESFVMPETDVEIKGIWTKNDVPSAPVEYEVSYKYTGTIPENVTALPATVKVAEGTTVTTAALPADVDGYTFEGWYVNGKLTESFVMPSADVEIEGRWTKNPVPGEYKITYIYTGEVPATAAELPAESSAATGSTVVTADVPASVAGYTFSGWYVNGKLTESFVMGEADVIIEGKWTKNPVAAEYKVTYKYTGEVPVNAPALPESVMVAEGKNVTTADIPAAVVGYDFAGWYYNGKLTESFTMPSNDVTIEGRWTKNGEYSVSYMYGGNDVGLEIPEAAYDVLPVDNNGYLPGATVTVADKPQVDGYKFHGWYYNGIRYDGDLASKFEMPNHNVILVGLWTKDVAGSYDVSYSYIGDVPANAAALPTIQTYEIGATVTVADVPATVEGYTFEGWYYNGAIVTSFTMPENDVVLIGVWSKDEIPVVEYGVTYTYEAPVPAGAPAVPVDANGYEVGDSVTVKALSGSLEGYEFDGWYYNGTKYSAGSSVSMVENGIVFVGKWIEIIPETYTVTYEYTGTVPANAPVVPVDTNEYEEGETVAVAALPAEVEGYTFSGWYYNNAITTSFTMPANNVVITGEWVEVPPESYVITYTYTGEVPANAPAVPAIATAKEGDAITVAAVPGAIEGYTFDGWYYNGAIVTSFTMPAENVTITGSWTAIKYDLVIDANGGQFSDGTQQYTDSLAAGDAINAPADPVKSGYDLVGWTDDNGNVYNKIPDTMPAGDVTFTAKWQEQEAPKHTITYYVVKGGNVYAIGTYAEGETMSHPVVGEIDGIIYDGWVDENGNPIQSVMGSTDLVAYAVAVGVKEYKATFIVDGAVYHEEMIGAGTEMSAHIPADPTKEGYLFSGWNPKVPGTMPAEDVTFVASFVKVPVESEEFTARYVVDDKTYALYVLEEGDAIPVPENPTKFGFKFVGWEPEVPATMPGNDVEFVAQWEIDKTFVTVVIGGAVVAGGVIAGIAGANAAWITGVSIVGGILVIVGTAHLIKHTHTVTYIVDGEVYKTYKVIEGTKIPVPADPAKEGAEFKGWEPEVPERMGNEDLVFEATWADIAGDDIVEDDDTDVDVEIPATGSAAGLAAFAVISGAAAAAYVFARKKKED